MSLETLKKRSDFLNARKCGRKWVARGLIVQAVPHDTGTMRVGYTVSKRVDKRAVKRNRIKRRLRALAHDVLPARADPSHNYVLIGRASTLDRPYQTLRDDLIWCLKKLGHLRPLNTEAAA